MNKSQVTRLDGIVENRLASVNNDKRHGATCYHNSKTISVSIRDTANNYSVAPNARTLFTQFLFKHLQQFDGPFLSYLNPRTFHMDIIWIYKIMAGQVCQLSTSTETPIAHCKL